MSIWFAQFLAWYHDHPFEIDQRGLHHFLALPEYFFPTKVRVAYPPEDLVQIQAGVLDDLNEVVIGDVGWVGDLSRMLIMHWCQRPLVQKEEELGLAYDAGDVAEEHGLSLVAGLAAASVAISESPWVKILQFKSALEGYQKSVPPQRDPCW